MNIFSWMGLGKDIAQTVDAVGNLYTTDKARLDGEQKLAETLVPAATEQLQNNRLMLAAGCFFSSGWQSLIGWTAGFLVLLYYAPQIIIATYVWGKLCLHTGNVNAFPIRPDDILNLVWLLFGFGGYHLVNQKMNRK